MSLGNDFLELIEPLWEIEEFNMWNPQAHLSIAYVLDGLYESEHYNKFFEKLLFLANKKDYNEFALEISKATLDVYKTDAKVEKADVEYMEKVMDVQFELYPLKELYVFGFVHEKYVPDWFFELFHVYITIEKNKRDNLISDYFVNECNMSEKRAENALKKLSSHTDILSEFHFFVKNKKFKEFYPITLYGISAKHLVDTTYLSPLGAYNYLIYLRESPEEALKDLKNGLPKS